MSIQSLKYLLTEAIDKAENIYNSYINRVNELGELEKKLELKEMSLQRDDAKLTVLMKKYKEVDSLEEARLNAKLTIKAAEGKMSEVAGERAKFEQYKSTELDKINKEKLVIDNERNKVRQENDNLIKAINDFNAHKKKFILTEGEASF